MTRLIFLCLFTKHTLPQKYLEYSHKIMEPVRSNIINFPMEPVKNSGRKKVAINYRKGATYRGPWIRSRRCPLRNVYCGQLKNTGECMHVVLHVYNIQNFQNMLTPNEKLKLHVKKEWKKEKRKGRMKERKEYLKKCLLISKEFFWRYLKR